MVDACNVLNQRCRDTMLWKVILGAADTIIPAWKRFLVASHAVGPGCLDKVAFPIRLALPVEQGGRGMKAWDPLAASICAAPSGTSPHARQRKSALRVLVAASASNSAGINRARIVNLSGLDRVSPSIVAKRKFSNVSATTVSRRSRAVCDPARKDR